MRILFIVIGNSRRSNYLNGYNLRYGQGGGSGTDSSCVIVAEYLAKQGHEIVFVTDPLEAALEEDYKSRGRVYKLGEEINGVKYTNIAFKGIYNLEFDILISMLWFNDYENLPIKVNKKIVYWSHMQWIYGISEIVNYAKTHNLKLDFVHISNWEKNMTESVVSHTKENYPKTEQYLIPNPVMDDVINEVLAMNLPKKKNKFVFHASWARGGNVAYNAVSQLDLENKELHAFDYLMTIHDYKDDWFFKHDGVDKKTLFTHLAEAEYFIYPLYTPYQDVHKDTFSCVVAEAIALGCIVITYPLGALPENFNTFCQWLDLPENTNIDIMQNEPLTKDLDGKFTITHNILDKINYLEQNPDLKEQLKSEGSQYILSKFSSEIVGKMWEELIKDL